MDLLGSLFGGGGTKTTAANHNTPSSSSSGLLGGLSGQGGSNPFFKAMNQETVTDLRLVSSGKLGSFLRRKGKVNGEFASIIDATLDFFLGDANGGLGDTLPDAFRKYEYTRNFIPIIIKSEFNLDESAGAGKAKPIYIVFDSTPENITFSKSANWSPKEILGRPEPVMIYSSSAPMQMTLTGDFFVSSKQDHPIKLKLADYLMSLAYPSRTRYMPTPIKVFIGEWKVFRAVVTSVSIDYKGPWFIKAAISQAADAEYQKSIMDDRNFDVNSLRAAGATAGQMATALRESKEAAIEAYKNIPSHAPYFFTATLNLTIISEENYVNYAEDIVSTAGKVQDALSLEDESAVSNLLVGTDALGSAGEVGVVADAAGAYSIYTPKVSTEYGFSDGTFSEKTKVTMSFNPDFNIFEDANNDRRRGDLAVITNSISNELSKVVKKLF